MQLLIPPLPRLQLFKVYPPYLDRWRELDHVLIFQNALDHREGRLIQVFWHMILFSLVSSLIRPFDLVKTCLVRDQVDREWVGEL